ncbi:hypothetical protein QYE76_009763 [Lolium multiflorum]|uniref:CCHC-type domain-containing protein n=1 Tax=Lolium multiflorum TaxID=4521 RepID=A0AAD8TSH7_LOLMU|nr:hypothetical protein QYE76_009763 [Lolium multiflorum]
MMCELKLIFETHAAMESYEASKQFFSCMMEEGSSVSEHMFAMSGHAKKLSDLGMMIPNQLGIHRVLKSLPPSYKNFVMNYNMQNMNKDLPELFSMLKSAEVEIKRENQVLMVNKTTGFKKQGKPNKGNFKKGGKKVASHPENPKAGPKPETVCYYCQGKGHWKHNCSKYLADLKSGHVKKKDLPDSRKAVKNKWIFKRKTDADGNVYKARLVMDVKTAFLNGDIEEELYMVQPKGFVDPENADKAGRDAARMASASRGGGVPRYKDGGAAARLLVGQVLHQCLGNGDKVGVRCWPAVRGGRSGGSGIVAVLMVCLWLRGRGVDGVPLVGSLCLSGVLGCHCESGGGAGLRTKVLPDLFGAGNGRARGRRFSSLEALLWSPDTPPPTIPG